MLLYNNLYNILYIKYTYNYNHIHMYIHNYTYTLNIHNVNYIKLYIIFYYKSTTTSAISHVCNTYNL